MNDMDFHGKGLLSTFLVSLVLAAPPCGAQQAKPSRAIDNLGAMSDGLEEITGRVLRCVVRITGETYLPEQEHYDKNVQPDNNAASASEVEGSGVLVSSDGYRCVTSSTK